MEVELLGSTSALPSKKPQEYGSVTEIMEMCCPTYLEAGMSYEQYWDGDVDMVVPYRQVLENRRRWQNQMLWLQGRYVYDALCAVMPALSIKTKNAQIQEYTKEPYPLSVKEARENEERHERERYEKMFNYMRTFSAHTNARFEKKAR